MGLGVWSWGGGGLVPGGGVVPGEVGSGPRGRGGGVVPGSGPGGCVWSQRGVWSRRVGGV